MPSHISRPPSISLSLRALLTFPIRLCSPPPSASTVRSCKVTPLLKVSLDDVLNKRHLPPLTLKDFEEWLVFVEGNPQYLYFILWLKEYEVRYGAWLAESGCTVPAGSSSAKLASPSTTSFGTDPGTDLPCHPRDRDLSYLNLIPSSPSLALFFTRAKQTFLDPTSNSPYSLGQAALLALNPSTHSLSPSIPHFTVPEETTPHGTVGGLPPHIAKQPHPHPKELAPLAIYARKILKESLERFSATACHNVGSRRALCGIVGGLFIFFVIGVLPTLMTIFYAPSRWWRVVGWVGCWLGGTIVISSLHGICMMIYIFGDFRQLRSFELARPAISTPRAIARARPKFKSVLTRGQATSGNPTSPGSGPQTESTSGPSQKSPQPLNRNNVSPMLAVPNKINKKKGPLSAATVSETSTGTPVVHLGPGAFRLGNGTVTIESDFSGATDSETGQGVIGIADDDDDGIVISPEYYYPGEGPDDMADSDNRENTGTGSKIGFVLRWVLGRRENRSGAGGGSGVGTVEIGSAVLDDVVTRTEKMSSWHVQSSSQRSYAGTFGVRSWRGGLGNVYERDGEGGDRDIERGRCGSCILEDGRGEGDDDMDLSDADGEMEMATFTAKFIPHDYPPGPERDLEAVIPAITIVPSTPLHSERGSGNSPAQTIDAKGQANVNVKEEKSAGKDGETHELVAVKAKLRRMSTPTPPVKFDFDKLPVRRMSTPGAIPISTNGIFSSSPAIAIRRERSLPEPLQLAIPPIVYTRPAIFAPTSTSLPLPASHASHPSPARNASSSIPIPPPLHDVKARQWWDTCPRHPAVEATFAMRANTNTNTYPTSKQPHSAIHADADAASMRAISLSSFDSHVRVGDGSFFDDGMAAPSSREKFNPNLKSPYSHAHAHPHSHSHPHSYPFDGTAPNNNTTWRDRLRIVTSVPAFGPVTRVLEPAVSRGQWEIVIRSGLIAALCAWVFIGSLLALPEVK